MQDVQCSLWVSISRNQWELQPYELQSDCASFRERCVGSQLSQKYDFETQVRSSSSLVPVRWLNSSAAAVELPQGARWAQGSQGLVEEAHYIYSKESRSKQQSDSWGHQCLACSWRASLLCFLEGLGMEMSAKNWPWLVWEESDVCEHVVLILCVISWRTGKNKPELLWLQRWDESKLSSWRPVR